MNELQKFKSLHKQWIEWLAGEIRHSVFSQLTYIMYDTLIYRTILKARTLCEKTNNGKLKLNYAIHYLIDKCYFESQALAIRRLIDECSDTISLHKIISVMEKNRTLLKRKYYFEVLEGYKYDYQNMKIEGEKYLAENLKFGKVICVPPELDWEKSAGLHTDLDWLCGTDENRRTPDDIIKTRIFKKLKEEMATIKNIKDYVDQFIAHSSINQNIVEKSSVTFNHIWEAQKKLSMIANFIRIYLLDRCEYFPLPHITVNWLSNIDCALVKKEQIHELGKEYEKFINEVGTWHRNLKILVE
jgi:hypothetical protein